MILLPMKRTQGRWMSPGVATARILNALDHRCNARGLRGLALLAAGGRDHAAHDQALAAEVAADVERTRELFDRALLDGILDRPEREAILEKFAEMGRELRTGVIEEG